MRKWLGPEKGNACLRKTHCPNGHAYDDENLYVAPNGWRQCKACRRVRVMESWERHKDKRKAENKAWREANAERCRENLLRWIEENRERYNLAHRLKKQRKRAAGTLTSTDWALVLKVYGNACLACDKPEVTIDHVVPVSKGGRNEIDNVQPLCGYCNTSKGTKTIDYRPAPLAELLADTQLALQW
jgi:5-methylcytosine-specific restriction endonuclease McrA